jgi:hypothetical protein
MPKGRYFFISNSFVKYRYREIPAAYKGIREERLICMDLDSGSMNFYTGGGGVGIT